MICAEKEDLSFNSIEFEAFMKDLSEGQQAVLIAYGNDKPSEYNPWEHDEDLHKEVQGFIMKCLER